MNQRENINVLLSGFYADSLSADELKRLQRCVSDKSYTADIVEWLRREWNEGTHDASQAPSEELFARIKAAIAKSEHMRKTTTAPRRGLRRALWTVARYAAVFVIAFVLSRTTASVKDIVTQDAAPQPTFNEVLVPYGSKTVIVLSDSSKIWLNAGARLKYPTKFADSRREVFLQGEGFFDVAKDAQRPFFVSANGLDIKVLGTKFNLMANADDNRIEATLVEGSIEVLGLSDEQKGGNLRLKPGQKLTLQKNDSSYAVAQVANINTLMIPREIDKKVSIKNAILSDNADLRQSTAWTENKLIFTRERFADVKLKLERWYGVTIDVKDNEILDYRFTGTFDKQTVEQAMKAFSQAASCRFIIKKDKVIVTKL